MMQLKPTFEIVSADFESNKTPISSWIDFIKQTLQKEIDIQKINFEYTFGYFILKSKNNVDEYNRQLNLGYNDRLKEELSKIRVDIIINYEKFNLKTRLNFIPNSIIEIIDEVTKVKMIVESRHTGNTSLLETIPNIESIKVKFQETEELIEQFSTKDLTIDNILDKISTDGIESLTIEEKSFLDSKGKDL